MTGFLAGSCMNSNLVNFAIVYGGLICVILALFIGMAINRWSLKVFFLLALRLAIGWHFLFEGLHKIHSHYSPNESTRPFSSEPYFRVAPGPLGQYMRKQFDDPSVVIAEKVTPTKEIPPAMFAKLPVADQAAACPTVVAHQLDSMETTVISVQKSEAEKQLANADLDEAKEKGTIAITEEKGLQEAKTEEEKNKVRARAEDDRKAATARAEAARQAAKKKIDSVEQAAQTLVAAAKASYARWVYGADGRNTKVKFITGDVFLTAPERLAHIERLRHEVKSSNEMEAEGLGNGYGINSKRSAEQRMELIAAETELARDANAFVAELKKELNGGKATEEVTPTSQGQRMDQFTMWFLVVVGGCIILGLFTRLSCVLAAGFLVMTYLAHPAFPWYPLPPNTEGNPVFVNKNIIECLALLSLACMPTGRWLGLDALVMRPFFSYSSDPCPPAELPPSATRNPPR